MAILKKVGALLLLALTACLVVDLWRDAPREPSFDHRVHVVDEGLDCTMCHVGAEEEPRAGLPAAAACALCHEGEGEDPELAPERTAAFFFEPDGHYRRQGAEPLSEEIRFSHARHFEAGVSCEGCHGDLGTLDHIPANTAITARACTSCHDEAGVDASCSTCHSRIDEDFVPDSHAHHWPRRHGGVARARHHESHQRCEVCHEESSCQACHQEQAPRDHTQFFRRVGHGTHLSLDRQRCATCHLQSDFCDRCHQESRPRSHTAGYGSPANRHCVRCHLPVQGEGCATCHQGAPSHFSAALLPADHHPGMDCRQCHGLSARLPHPDSGVSCTACHR